MRFWNFVFFIDLRFRFVDIYIVVWKIGGVYIKFLGGNMFVIGRENFFIVVINIDDRFLIFFLFYF